ncbi:CWF19-like protein 2-like protein [Operophtera brumata]|uniref:CWF19-like protein 2-like protein n=1 Tax=Operophtera brumata TaxID=104452 RepID=A0A0L7LUA3_OPEBR|nr:CWF19-like protein 2-like protein [Operophtera brumata]
MAMTGVLKTYTKEDIRPKKQDKDKKHIDSYNPATSSRELNPYWKDGGEGLPQTTESFRKSRKFLKPCDDDDFYTKRSSKDGRTSSSYITYDLSKNSDRKDRDNYSKKSNRNNDEYNSRARSDYPSEKTYNWRKSESTTSKSSQIDERNSSRDYEDSLKNSKNHEEPTTSCKPYEPDIKVQMKPAKDAQSSLYLSDEKMNKLGAKIIKAEIMGDMKVVAELKAKLEEAKQYRKQNPGAGKEEDDRVMLISTNSSGNSRPLAKTSKEDARSKGGKRKAETHISGERAKYFGNDDKYNLAQMVKLARIASKSKNPNDDLEDIFMDEISKNRNEGRDDEAEKQRAISQHAKMERSLDGCEYCLDSKNMLKHLMVSCGNKVYVAVPARTSLVKDHCLIATMQHSMCVTALDEDVWEEVMNYRKALTQFYNSQNQDVVFFETATKLHRFPHMVINCVPLPRDVGDVAAIYFKKALLECETEWSMNKKVVDLKGKNIRKGMPKGLPYFWVDFGMEPGFAHVIEDQQLFPKTFAEEIIAGILDLDHRVWKNTRKEYGDLQRRKVMDFVKEWKPFDPNKSKNIEECSTLNNLKSVK